MSDIIAENAYEVSRSTKAKTPYMRKYKKAFKSTLQGGKVDDIGIVCTMVVSN